MRIPDDLPSREPDGVVKGEALNFYFWLGNDSEGWNYADSELGDVDEPTFDFGDDRDD